MIKTIYSKQYKEIIAKLRKVRIEAGLSQLEVAEKLAKPQSYVSKIERGDRRLDIAELKIIAGIYKKPVSYFVD